MKRTTMNDLLTLSYVPRWGIVSMNRHQSVAEHSYRVTIIWMTLVQELKLDYTDQFWGITWSLFHDGGEANTGDIPNSFKRVDPSEMEFMEEGATPWWAEFKNQVPAHVRELVKVADLIETATWVKVWGVGSRAGYAGDRILKEILDKTEYLETAYPGITKVATALFWSILQEEGRVPARTPPTD